MTTARKAIAGVAALVIGALAFSGCAAVRDLITEAPLDLPSPSLPARAEPFEKIYQGGERPAGISDEEWETKSQRRIAAAAAFNGILVFGVDDEGTNSLTVKIKGDPEDADLIANIEDNVVPVALSWASTVTVVVDPSLCSIAGEVRDDTPLCDAVTGG